jgi:hypothetical protein
VSTARHETDQAAAGTGASRPVHPTVDLDADLPALQESRDFLLRSLKDLEAEHEAGDIDDVDYQGLKDDYTARTADVLRAIESRTSPRRRSPTDGQTVATPTDAERSRRRWRTTAAVAGILLFGVLAGWAVTATSGSRVPGQSITGNSNLRSPTNQPPAADPRLAQAGQLVNKGNVTQALKLYDQILQSTPNQPEALANSGWLIAQAGLAAQPVRTDLVDSGLNRIQAAEQVAPSYPSPHFFRGFLLFRGKNDPAGAVTELRQYLGLVDPSSAEVPMVTQLLQQAMAAAGPAAPKP